MKMITIQRSIALTAALIAAVTWLMAGDQAADAGHTIGDKHCQSTGSITCRVVYSPAGKDLIATQSNFHLWIWRTAARWDDVTDEPVLDDAEYNWAVAVGPQVPVEPFPSGPDFPFTNNFLYHCDLDSNPPSGCF